ncbi:MAG: tetratricopeptide repeat protein [Trueperaceae bacterium]|nr:tetratricopeptide repeat protein [Trueperaceae bacterium]
MRLTALGGLVLEPSSFTRPTPLLLLSYLAVEGAKDRRHLAELFWQEGNRLKSLSMALTLLKQGAGNVVETDKSRVWTSLESDVKDLLEALDKSDWETAKACYSGAFLEGLSLNDWGAELEEWVYSTREYLAERVQYALLNLAEDLAKKQDFEQAGRLAEKAYKLPGLGGNELATLKRLYPLLCAANSLLAPVVRKEAESYDLKLELNTQTARDSFVSIEKKALGALPLRNTSFIGRKQELAELSALIRRPGKLLVNLVGTGGVGKTRLALQLAEETQKAKNFNDGVFFITLDALKEGSLIAASLLAHFGLKPDNEQEALAQVTDFLLERDCLLIIDNFEHLTESAVLLSELLSRCHQLKLLVTSRETLRLEEEHIFWLEGLTYPQTVSDKAFASDAVQLFKERAQQIQPHFRLGENMSDVLSICRSVDGMPLAIELAASWLRLMTCTEIASEITQSLELLISANRNIPDRHRSLRGVFDHSWQLLSPKEQEVLARLSVFRSGFRREAANEVLGASIPVLRSLVDQSLLRALPNGRYELHPLVRQYSREKLSLAELEAVQENLANFFVSLVFSLEEALWGKDQQHWLSYLEQELDNLRRVFAWSLENSERLDKGLQLGTGLLRFWLLRGYFAEGRNWLEALLAQYEPQGPLYIKSLYTVACLAHEQGDYSIAQSLYEKCIALGKGLKEESVVAKSLEGLGRVAHERGDYEAARSFHEQSLALERNNNNERGISSSLNSLGVITYYQRDFPTAQRFFEESLALRRKLGDEAGVGATYNNLGLVALGNNEPNTARSYFLEGLSIQKSLEDKRSITLTYCNLTILEEGTENYQAAKRFALEALKIATEIGYKRAATLLLQSLGNISRWENAFATAVIIWGALEQLREATGIPLHEHDRDEFEQELNAVKMHLSEDEFRSAWARGKLLDLEQVAQFCYSLGDPEILVGAEETLG